MRQSLTSMRPSGMRAWSASGIAGWEASLPTFAQGEMIADPPGHPEGVRCDDSPACPGLVAGAADLTGNTGTKLAGQTIQAVRPPRADGRSTTAFASTRWARRWSAWRKHGGVLPAGGTFFVFLDYMRPPVRLAALSKAKVLFVFTHDSVGVGEDGPTHQPVEHIATLRAIPHLQVIRPADANETAQAWKSRCRARRSHRSGAQPPGRSRGAPTGPR